MTGAAPFGLYVHWPFCRSKCPYCDFNSHVAEAIDHRRWRDAYRREMEAMAPRVAGRAPASIFFGGGTPSLMEPETVATVIDTARVLWPEGWRAGEPEITLEANPTSIEAAKFAAFRDAGVNRVSVGVQALDDEALRFLGREHSADEALAALAVAQETFARVNADMIYARPGQGVSDWRSELRRLISMGLGHVSLYQLTIERGTPFFGLHNKGAFALPDDETAAALYEETGAVLAESGLFPYEVSNYARPEDECRHNLIYWRYGDYLGIGPGAHGRVPGRDGCPVATVNARRPGDWLERAEATGTGLSEETPLEPRVRLEEMVMMGLRLSEGIDDDAVARVGAGGIDRAFDPQRLARLVAGGFIAREGTRLRATGDGRMRLNAVVAELLA
ncbi:MAG: radical SAM family heme chaperone HemW [Alphaproteobacteria bacterium]